ncbi:MAG: class I SAM-dependent methyltransferase [candidate division Zixibacteria bacterium]|nr:class I SAM-dependent methyltransferase [candidate division Zixibacteria bacterium]
MSIERETRTRFYAEDAFVADLYDHVRHHADRADIGFYVDAATACHGSVLELGCGTGRILLPTARAGVRITGLDLSEPMLARCRDNLAREPEAVRSHADIVAADITSFDLGRTYALITTPGLVFQHLVPIEQQINCLDCIRCHLQPGGRLILDLFDPHLPFLMNDDHHAESDPPVTMPDGRVMVAHRHNRHVDLARQIIVAEAEYTLESADGEVERLSHAFELRYFFRFEIEHMLARCGYVIETMYGGFDKCHFGSHKPGLMIVVARADT